MGDNQKGADGKVGWRISEFSAATGISRASVYNYIASGHIRAVKLDGMRIIITPPLEFLRSFEAPAVGGGERDD